MIERCRLLTDGEGLWTFVDGLRQRAAEGWVVQAIENGDHLRRLIARQLGYSIPPGAAGFDLCTTALPGLVVGWLDSPDAVLHRTPSGTVHLAMRRPALVPSAAAAFDAGNYENAVQILATGPNA